MRNLARRPLLRDASLEVRAGEIVGLAGLVGSGRSELAQAVFGVAPPESGTIEIDGRAVNISRAEDAIELGIAYAPEDRQRQGLVVAMTVGENIGLTRIWQLMRGPFLNFEAEDKLADEYIQMLRIKTPNSHQVTRNLSGGNQQKVVLGKWLAIKPRLLIVDEPTRGIDVGARAEIHRLLDKLAREENMAILVISSDLPEVLRLSDRICVMREGYLVAEFARHNATQENILAAAVGQQANGDSTSAAELGALANLPFYRFNPCEASNFCSDFPSQTYVSSGAPREVSESSLDEPFRAKQQPGDWLAIFNQQEGVLVVAFLLVLGGVTALNRGFIASTNLVDILYNSSYIGVAAVGMTMIILCGHIDISIGAALGLCATVAGKLAVAGVPLWIVFAATIITGGLIGLANGLLVAYCRIPAIVATLGMASILKGGLILTTGGIWIYGLPPGFGISRRLIMGIPLPICALVLFGVVFSIWLKYAAAGRQIYAVGGNAEAARLSGIPVRNVTLGVFVMNGLLVGISAILYATNFTAIQSNVAPGFELTVITSAVIGGVSILGGTGTVIGALLGAILLQTIGTALVFLHIRAEWFQTVQGSLILLTILLDVFRRRQTFGRFNRIGRSGRRRRRGCFTEIHEPSVAGGSGSRADRHPDRCGHRVIVYF